MLGAAVGAAASANKIRICGKQTLKTGTIPNEKNGGSEGEGIDRAGRLFLKLLSEKVDANPLAASVSIDAELSRAATMPGAAGCFALRGL